MGYIHPFTSPVAAGFFFIEKKDSDLALITYGFMVCYPYHISLVPSALEQLRESGELDRQSAYNLIRIKEVDEWTTTFHTRKGHYEYLVMPYGLTNAPAVFQAFINKIFRDFLDHYVIAYIDDILIYSANLEDHAQHVCTVLSQLK